MVERDDRATVASFYVGAPVTTPLAPPIAAGAAIELPDAAAHHARVKRLAAGDPVRLTNGAGVVGIGSIAAIGKSAVRIDVETVASIAAPSPIHLRAPIGDRERMLWLAEKATELGIATWQSVRFRRSASVTPRGEGPAFADKIRARMISALEQSGGAWLPRIEPDATVDSIDAGGGAPILLDASGPWLASVLAHTDGSEATIVLGPEGGIESDELDALRARGWLPARVAETTLRFETAGLAAVSVCRNTQFPTER